MVSAASCISRSGSRMAAMRCDTLASRSICSARCWPCASALRSASFSRASSRAFSAACAAWSCASASRRTMSASCSRRNTSSRRSNSSCSASTRLRQRLAVRRGLDEDGQDGAVERAHRQHHHRRPRRGLLGVAPVVGEQGLQLRALQPVQERVHVPRRVAAQVRRHARRHLGQLPRPGLHQPVPVRPQARGRLLEGQREGRRHAFFSPVYRCAMPAVRAQKRTPSKPAAVMAAANSAGAGKRPTDAGR